MPAYVIGHRNPDTDAICSAIAYADLLRKTTLPDAEAVCCGEATARTRFALEAAGVPQPRLLLDVRLTLGQVCRREIFSASPDESLYQALNRLRANNIRSMPVVDANQRVLGLLSLQKALDLLLPNPGEVAQARIIDTSLQRIADVLGATFQNVSEADREAAYIITVAALSEERFAKRLATYVPRDLVVVAGDRPNVHQAAIEHGVCAIIITGDNRLNDGLLRRARQCGVNILLSPHDTATTTLLVKCAKRITDAIIEEFTAFPRGMTVRDAVKKTGSNSQPLFPVVDEDERIVGVISRSDLVNPAPQRLVLVDHNELSQAVSGADEAEILEVIDHHRIGGGLASRSPIRFINEPVGSTCTIVAQSFRERGIDPSPSIALCMAAGIVSDTLNLKSPTTTPVDAAALSWLSSFVDRPLDVFANDFFAAGSPLRALSPAEAVRGDLKQYAEYGWKIAVAQIEEVGFDLFWNVKTDLQKALDALNADLNTEFACLLVTDISTQDSVLLVSGDTRLVDAIAFPRLDDRLYQLNGIVSRKKQLLPYLMRLLAETPRDD
jgi:manganese-dependent inorganic pyrophosphatase